MKIVIRTPNWLGDLMMSTSFVQAVLHTFPESQVDLIVKQGFQDIPLPHRGKLIPFDKTKQSISHFSKILRKEEYDLFYVLPPSFSSAWMAFQSFAKKRVGYSQNFRGFLLTQKKKYLQSHKTQHLVDEYLQLIDGDFSKEAFPPFLNIHQAWLDHTLKEIELPTKFIAIAPGTIYGTAKQWPTDYYQTLVQKYVTNNINVVLIGTKKDVELTTKIQNGITTNILNLCGKTNINEVIAVLSKAICLVSNDSGAMHIMSALQKHQIAIFGSTSPIWTGPLNQKAVIFSTKLECSPCFQRTCKFNHYNCLYSISPEHVFEKSLEKINES